MEGGKLRQELTPLGRNQGKPEVCRSKGKGKGTVKEQRRKGPSWSPRNQFVRSGGGCGRVKRGKDQVFYRAGGGRDWTLDSRESRVLEAK